MNQDKSTILVPAQFGAPFEGGFYAGQIRSGEKVYGVAVAPKEFGGTRAIWLPSYTDVPNAASCFHSMDNTLAMAAAGSPLGKFAIGREINGKTDWCVPARDVLELMYRNLKPTAEENAVYRYGDNPSSIPPGYPYTEASPAQTDAEAFRDGGPEAFEEAPYWSSAQYSEFSAWFQYFGSGTQDNTGKKAELRARLVRLIQLNA